MYTQVLRTTELENKKIKGLEESIRRRVSPGPNPNPNPRYEGKKDLVYIYIFYFSAEVS